MRCCLRLLISDGQPSSRVGGFKRVPVFCLLWTFYTFLNGGLAAMRPGCSSVSDDRGKRILPRYYCKKRTKTGRFKHGDLARNSKRFRALRGCDETRETSFQPAPRSPPELRVVAVARAIDPDFDDEAVVA